MAFLGFSWLLGLLPFGKIIQMGLDIVYSLIIKLLGLIFYLASEYWGRWVLFAFVVACALMYGRYYYIQQGRAQEAKFCDLRIDDALRTRPKSKVSPHQTPLGTILDEWFRPQ
jgi:hypothetical protein